MGVANPPGEVHGSGGKALVFVGERTAGPDRDIHKLRPTKCLSAYADDYVATRPRPVSANAGDSLMKVATVFLLVIAAVTLAGCGTTTGERTGSGALLGAGTGAAIGSFSGNAGKGALIGAGAGALGGYLYDQDKKQQSQPYYDQNRTRQDQYYYDQNRARQDQYYYDRNRTQENLYY
jgi:YMGG-like Gly-zipper